MKTVASVFASPSSSFYCEQLTVAVWSVGRHRFGGLIARGERALLQSHQKRCQPGGCTAAAGRRILWGAAPLEIEAKQIGRFPRE